MPSSRLTIATSIVLLLGTVCILYTAQLHRPHPAGLTPSAMSAIRPYPQILILGDSISQGAWIPGGFAQQLAADYSHAMDVVNRGMGGYTSRQLLYKLEEDMLLPGSDSDVKLILIGIGTNDSVLNGIQYVHIDEYRANLAKIISFVRTKFPRAHLILLTPTILDSSAWQDHLIQQGDAPTEKQRSEANQRKYAEACKEVGLREGVLTVDQWNAMNDPVTRGEVATTDVLSDGLHLTSLGYQMLYPHLRKTIDSNFPELSPDVIPRAFEEWKTYHVEN